MKGYLLFSLAVTTIIYLIGSFINWDIFWLSDIGSWDISARVFFSFGFIAKEIYSIMIYQTCEIKDIFK